MSSLTVYAMPQGKTLRDYLGIFRRQCGVALWVAALALVATVAIALAWPPLYRSSATILIEQQEIPTDLVRSTVSSYADQRIQIITQRVMTRANLVEIIRKYDLYAEDRRSDPLEVVVEAMRKDIEMKTISAEVVDPRSGRPTQATIAFTLTYENQSPQLAQKVANELTSLYLNENLSSRREMASQASDFLTEEADRVSEQISELERLLAEFKERNVERLPDMAQFNMQLADRTDRELMDVEQTLRSLKERRIYLHAQLLQVNPRGSLYSESGERILDPADRLKSLRARYISQSGIYAAGHPDLVRMRKEIASLEAEVGTPQSAAKELDASLTSARGELAVSRERYGKEHPTVERLERQVAALEQDLAQQRSAVNTPVTEEADNPAYIQLQAQLQAVDAEIASLQEKETELRNKLRGIDQRIAGTPAVEQQYRGLSRDYDNAWAKYKDLKAKQMEAKLAESLETGRKGERFTLIEPPLLPEEPAKPNRMAIVLLGILLSIASGVAAAAVRENMDGTVRGAKGVTAVIDMTPLAGIPYIATEEDARKAVRRRWMLGGAVTTLISVVVLGAHFFFMPLDVLWYVVLRRFEF